MSSSVPPSHVCPTGATPVRRLVDLVGKLCSRSLAVAFGGQPLALGILYSASVCLPRVAFLLRGDRMQVAVCIVEGLSVGVFAGFLGADVGDQRIHLGSEIAVLAMR